MFLTYKGKLGVGVTPLINKHELQFGSWLIVSGEFLDEVVGA